MRDKIKHILGQYRLSIADDEYDGAVDEIIALAAFRAATEARLQKLSDAVQSYISNIAAVYPGVSREDGERRNYERLQRALTEYGLPQRAYAAIRAGDKT